MLITVHNGRSPARPFSVTCTMYAKRLESKCIPFLKRTKQFPVVFNIVITHIERAIAAFAKVPYHDRGTQREFDQLFGDLDEAPRLDNALASVRSPISVLRSRPYGH
jgi:hypothetical protein